MNLRRLAVLSTLSLLVSCGRDGGPTVIVEPSVRFEPAAGSIQIEAYELIRFAVFDEKDRPLSARWTLGGADQGESESFDFLGATVGAHTLVAELQYAGLDHAATWQLDVSSSSSSITPRVVIVQSRPGPSPGSIRIAWERPPASQVEVPLREFELYLSESIFDEADLENMTATVVPVDFQFIEQTHLFSGLEERVVHYSAVRVVDVLDRRSSISPVVNSESTGHFDLMGSVTRIDPQQAALKTTGNVISLGSYRTVTDQSGDYALTNIPDLLEMPLVVAHESGTAYYEFRSLDDWLPVTQSFDVMLFIRDFVFLKTGLPGSEILDQVSMLDFLKYMSHNGSPGAGALPIYRWESYPVQVYVPPHMENGVDYRLSFERGVAYWNEVAGETLFEIVDSPVGVGVDYTVDLGPGDPFSGVTLQLQPAGEDLFESVPELMRIRLFPFNNQGRCDQVVVHELGHVLMLNHSPSAEHVMVNGATSGTAIPHRDEAYVARLIANLDIEFDLRLYRDPSAKTQSYLMPRAGADAWCGTGPVRFDRSLD